MEGFLKKAVNKQNLIVLNKFPKWYFIIDFTIASILICKSIPSADEIELIDNL